MADKTPDTGFFHCEGGTVIEMDLPLPEVQADKVTKGLIRRVNEDGTPYEGDAVDPSDGAGVTSKPAVAAPKAEWIGWALHCDEDLSADDAEAMTKQDLIEKYGSKGS
jgi:hypothetical protein